MNPKFNLKWYAIWVIIHSVSLFILAVILQYFNVKNGFIQVLFIGFGVTIIARLVKRITKKKQFIVDKWFFFWSLINTFTIWLMLLLISLLQITNNLASLFFMASGLVIIAYFVKKLKITRTSMIVTSIILLVVLFLFNSNSNILSDSSSKIFDTQTTSVKSNNILSNIKESIKSIPSSMFGETVEVNLRIACDTMSNFEDLERKEIGDKIISRGCEDVCPAKTTKYSGSYRCDTDSGFIMCSCRDTPETTKFKQDCQNLCNSNKLCEYAEQEEGNVSFQQDDGKLCSCDCTLSKQSTSNIEGTPSPYFKELYSKLSIGMSAKDLGKLIVIGKSEGLDFRPDIGDSKEFELYFRYDVDHPKVSIKVYFDNIAREGAPDCSLGPCGTRWSFNNAKLTKVELYYNSKKIMEKP